MTLVEPSFFKVGLNYQESNTPASGVDTLTFRANSMAYFKKIKSPNAPFPIRIMTRAQPQSIPYPFVVGDSDINGYFGTAYQTAVAFAQDPAFDVIFNINAGPLTIDSWEQSRQSALIFAQLVKDSGLKMEISIGNELADVYGIQYVGNSFARSNTTVTSSMISPFQTHVGDVFTIYGAGTGWNQQWTVTSVIDSKHFTFEVPNTLSATTGGGVYSVSLHQLNQNYRDLAAQIHQINPNQKVSAGEFNKIVNGVSNIQDMMDNGIGELDYFSMHTYPNGFHTIWDSQLTAFMNMFPNNTYISEFNGDSGNATGQWLQERGVNTMRDLYDRINAQGVKRAIIWSWDTNLAVHFTDGTFHPIWGPLVNNNGRIPVNAQNPATQRQFVS